MRVRIALGAGLWLLGLLAACLPRPPFGRRLTEGVRLAAGRLEYSGELSAEHNRRLFALYAQADPKPGVLAIQSMGGDIEFGMELGEWVFEQQLDLEIERSCFSSCASYVFPAAVRKRVARGAIVAWDGGADSPANLERMFPPEQYADPRLREAELAQQEAGRAARIRAAVERERAFYARIGVDPRLPTLGLAPRYLERFRAEDGFIGWYYPLPDLERLGVGGVEVIGGGDWRPRALNEDQRWYRVELGAEPATDPGGAAL